MIFYWLADVKRPGQFERTIQALIGTGVITLLVSGIETVCQFIGTQWFVLGMWTPNSEATSGFILAVLLGLCLAYASNHDHLYRIARNWGLTSKASYPEWIFAFRKRAGKNVVLTFLDGRRLYGYPYVWPTDPKEGYFLITQPSWLDEDGKWVDTPGIESYIVSNVDVYLIEFMQ